MAGIRDILKKFAQTDVFKTSVFIMMIIVMSYFYNYHEIINYRPTSMHQWRNSVSASIALNYAHEGDFFHSRTHHMQVDHFSSDITIVEFPVIYYFIGMLYRFFGFHEWIYKLVQLLIGFTGLYLLFRLGLRIFKNLVYALFLPAVIFSSPIFVYYLNNFMPDAPSLAIALGGFCFFYRFYEEGRPRDFIVSIIVLVFGGMIKAPAFLIFFAIAGIFLLERIFRMHFKSEGLIFSQPFRQFALSFGLFLIAVSWYAYAKIYSDIHGGIVSNVEIRPIWILSKETIAETWNSVKIRFHKGQYHHPGLLSVSLLLFIHLLICRKKYNKLLFWLTVLGIAGGISFSLFFFRSLRNHDYYQMNNLIILVLIIIGFLDYLKRNHAKIFHSWYTKLSFAAVGVLLFLSCHKLINSYYYNGWFEEDARRHYNHMYNDITPYLRSLGIERTDKVYCTPDPSINISLYLMDQKGYTDFFQSKLPFPEKIKFLADHGLQYVIIGGDTYSKEKINNADLKKIGEHNGATIYRMDNKATLLPDSN